MKYITAPYYFVWRIIHFFFPIDPDVLQEELRKLDEAFWDSEGFNN